MPVNLSTTSSIVDYLSTLGKDSSYSARKTLYNTLGLNERLGDYTGSGTQNTNLLNYLKTQSSAPTEGPYGMSTPTGNIYYAGPGLTYTSLPTGSTPPSPTTAPTPPPLAPTSSPKPAAISPEGQPTETPTAPPPTEDQSFGAADALGALGMSATGIPSADAALQQVLDSPGYQAYLEEIGLKNRSASVKNITDKQKLDQEFVQKSNEINESFGKRGLFFSGMRPADLRQLSENLAVSKLGVDREFATALLANDIDARQRLYDDVEKLITKAVSGSDKARSDALDQLNRAGYALIGDKLIPTVEYRRLTNEKSEFRNVDGVGLVKITGDSYEIVIPEQAKPETLSYKQKVDLEVKLANDFEKFAKTSRDASRSINIITTGYNEAVNAGFDGRSLNAPSQAVLVTFQKMLDPTSVVRESEYARSGDGQSLYNRITGTIEKLKYGGAGVTQAELKEFYDVSQQLLKGYQTEQLNFAKRVQTQAGSYGLDIDNILTPDILSLLNTAGGSGGTTTLTPSSSSSDIDSWLNSF